VKAVKQLVNYYRFGYSCHPARTGYDHNKVLIVYLLSAIIVYEICELFCILCSTPASQWIIFMTNPCMTILYIAEHCYGTLKQLAANIIYAIIIW